MSVSQVSQVALCTNVDRFYVPALVNRKKAGYGVKSSTGSTMDGVCKGEGMTRLGALADGVKKGVFTEGVLVLEERVLSLLRERFDEAGEAGTCSGVPDMMVSVSVLTPPMSLALRLRARSLCSLKRFELSSGAVVGPGIGGTRKPERGGMVTTSGREDEGLVAFREE
jgi:hypothetical protein